MNYIRSGTFKNGTATNIDQGVSILRVNGTVAQFDASDFHFFQNGTQAASGPR